MATKTVINCMADSVLQPHQGISIIIDQQTGNLKPQTNFLDSNHSPNIIKIQHSSEASSSGDQSSQQLLTLSSSSTTTTSIRSTTLLNNDHDRHHHYNHNKTLIDINRNNDHMTKDPSTKDHVLQINCPTTSNEISREIIAAKENSNIKLETNGRIEMGALKENDHQDHSNGDHNNEEENVTLNGIVKKEVKEFTKYNQHNFDSPEEDDEKEDDNDEDKESGQTTSQQQHFQQQQVNKNNGNSKYSRENGQNSLAKYEHNKHDIHKHNNDDHNDDHDDHNDDHHDHNELTSLGDNHDDHNNDDNSANTAKRVMVGDFSHAKRSFNEENSSSLETKADATTASSTTLTINELIENHSNHKENHKNINQNNKQNKSFENFEKENLNHVVKIQIKLKDLLTEKQVTVVKIENLEKSIEKPLIEENKAKEKQEKSEKIENIENLSKEDVKDKKEIVKELKQESVEINDDKMVQKPSKNNNPQTVTVSNNTHTSSTTGSATVSNTGSTTVTELNVNNNSNYLYYMMSSGQFSPSDTLDSGTGSDLESNGQQSQQTSNNHIAKKSSNTAITPLEMHIKTTKIRVSNSSSSSKDGQHRQCSFTDSEESEASSLSCDSLHSNEFLRQQSASPIETQTTGKKKIQSFLPDSLLREIKNLKFSSNDYEAENEEEDDIVPQLNSTKSHNNYESDNNYETINTQDYKQETDYVQTRNRINNSSMSSSLKRASLPSKTFVLNTEDGTFIDTKMNSMPRTYEADKYYNFHVNEHDNFRSFGNNSSSSSASSPNGDGDSFSISDYDTKSLNDDVFAGYKDIRCGSNTSTIRSSKGTVRGVKNRVRNGIATFLQLQQPNVKNFKEKDSGKVVLYTTSMGIIRDTYAKCSNVKQILRTLLVKFEERDVFMSVEYQQEIKERMHSEIIKVPQLYVEGQHIGDADTVERLNESGELRQLLKPYKSISTTYTCQTCGGYRLLPCPSCNGSKKSVHRNHFTAEFVALKCMNCDEVGLVKCHNC